MLAGLFAGAATAQDADTPPARITCAELADCLAIVRDPQREIARSDADVDERMLQFGDAAIDALVPLLSDPNEKVREKAGYALSRFRTIDPRHFPAIAAAWQPGDWPTRRGGWLPRAIAATGTDEALALLWRDFLRDPDAGSNSQIFFALTDFGEERIRPLMLDRFGQCRDSMTGDECRGLDSLLAELKPPFPAWSVEQFVSLAGDARLEEVRQGAVDQLVRLRHPAGREPSRHLLAAYPAEDALEDYWGALRAVDNVVKYGAESRASGPDIARFLDPRFDDELRVEAALALGRIDDRSAIPALMALAGEFEDDWLLAYNAVESLGRLRATEAHGLVRRTAETHWHAGVRSNAQRALSAIAGGAFASPGRSNEDEPHLGSPGDEEAEYDYFGPLRWVGDSADGYCREPGEERRVDQAGALRFPRSGNVELQFEAPNAATASDVREHFPVTEVQGTVVAVVPLRNGDLVAFNGGEFGGGVFHLPEAGPPRPLTREPVEAMWRMGRRIYVAAGLTHLVLDFGHLYVIDPTGPRVERTIRLPASPRRILALSEHVVVIETREGDFALREDGTPVDPRLVESCAEEE